MMNSWMAVDHPDSMLNSNSQNLFFAIHALSILSIIANILLANCSSRDALSETGANQQCMFAPEQEHVETSRNET